MKVQESEPASGILEILPDGYGFLRGHTLLPGKKDIYVSMAQIRRFGLRTGDLVEGTARSQRDSDKFAALLTVDVKPAERRFGIITPWTPQHSAVRRMDPRL